MLAEGEWVAENPDSGPGHRSFHLNELYSPVTRWGSLAKKFRMATREAKTGNTASLHNFINSSLGEPWSEDQHRGDPRPVSFILGKRNDLPEGIIPAGTVGIVAGADTQDNGFWLTVWAFDTDLGMHLVTDGFVPDLATLYTRTARTYQTRDGALTVPVYRVMIDAMGHRTTEVYEFARKNPLFQPVQGDSMKSATWATSSLDTYKGRDGKKYQIPGGLNLLRLDGGYFKNLLATKLHLEPGQAGGVTLHRDTGEEFARQMGVEYKDERGNWKCPHGKDNHLWDCTVYALFGADVAGFRGRQVPAGQAGQGKRKLTIIRRSQ
jgi:phage terminase large subunit GpA-like protein